MRVNLDDDESVIASLPKIWGIALGWMGFFHKSKEGVLALTNKNIIFAPRYLYITSKEREKYFGEDKARVAKLTRYSETDLDEDISKNERSLIVPLQSLVDVQRVTIRKANFVRISLKDHNK